MSSLSAKVSKIFILGLLLELLVGCSSSYSDVPIAATATATTGSVSSSRSALSETGGNLPVSNNAPRNTSAQLAQTIRNELDNYMTSLSDNKLFSGTVLVVQSDRIFLNNSYSYADNEQRLKSNWYNIFPLGGITKQFTAAAILILEQENKLKVEDPLCHYLPECPPDWQAITLHQVLNHSAGLPAEYQGRADPAKMYRDSTELASALQELSYKRLAASPGQRYLYSNFGYNLLGYVIQKVSKKAYETFLDEKIFTPLGMQFTTVGKSPATLSGYAIGYQTFGNPITSAPDQNSAAEGIYSSMGDLYRWDMSLYTNIILSNESLGKMFKSQVEITPFSSGKEAYGYGWVIDKFNNRVRQYHMMLTPGFSGIIVRYPQDKISLIVLSNLHTVDSRLLSSTLITTVFEQLP